MQRPSDWFWLGVDHDAEPLQTFDEPWTGPPQAGWHSVEWFAYRSGAAQPFTISIQRPTLLATRTFELALAPLRSLRAQPPFALAERITLDLGYLNRYTDFSRLERDLAKIRQLGLRALRVNQEWSAAQRAVGGPYDWQPLDALRARLGQEPWRLIVILGLANPWYAEACPLFGVFQGFPPVAGCPEYRAAWRAFVTAQSQRWSKSGRREHVRSGVELGARGVQPGARRTSASTASKRASTARGGGRSARLTRTIARLARRKPGIISYSPNQA